MKVDSVILSNIMINRIAFQMHARKKKQGNSMIKAHDFHFFILLCVTSEATKQVLFQFLVFIYFFLS